MRSGTGRCPRPVNRRRSGIRLARWCWWGACAKWQTGGGTSGGRSREADHAEKREAPRARCRRAPGVGDLEVYFDPAVSMEEKTIFGKYVHEHLLQHARDVERLRHYVCPECGTPVGNREVAMKRLNGWLHGRPPQPKATGFSSSARRRRRRRALSAWAARSGCRSGMRWSSASPARRLPPVLWNEVSGLLRLPPVSCIKVDGLLRFSSGCATCRRSPPSS